MLKRISFFIAGAALLLFAHYHSEVATHLYFLWAPITLLFLIYFFSEDDYVSAGFLGAMLLVSYVFKWNELRHSQAVLFFGGVVGVLFLWWFFLWSWNRQIAAIEMQKRRILDDTAILRGKYNARMESLTHLERQVTGLLNLFEMAKDFNECLSFEELTEIMAKKMAPEVPFDSLNLIVTGLRPEEKGRPAQTLHLNLKMGEKAVRSPTAFDLACHAQAGEAKMVRFESSQDLAVSNLSSFTPAPPLWIFSLQMEGKTIAVLVVEGGRLDDFPKFELLASQLALQVKKISLYETMKELSIIDGLTKTFVRRHFLERFEEELRRALKRNNPLSVLLLDIDHFKSYNDTFGHLVGDSTLREVAAVIREHVRRVDLVARYGGEEFAIVMPEAGSPTNLETAERIRSAIARKRFRLYDEETKVTVSIGVASFPKDVEEVKAGKPSEFKESLILELIQKADKALYRAKEEGRNRVVSYHQI